MKRVIRFLQSLFRAKKTLQDLLEESLEEAGPFKLYMYDGLMPADCEDRFDGICLAHNIRPVDILPAKESKIRIVADMRCFMRGRGRYYRLINHLDMTMIQFTVSEIYKSEFHYVREGIYQEDFTLSFEDV